MDVEKNKKIEPHIILHLRITQDDIEKYLENKIQTSTEDIVPTILNFTYEACNIDVFTKHQYLCGKLHKLHRN